MPTGAFRLIRSGHKPGREVVRPKACKKFVGSVLGRTEYLTNFAWSYADVFSPQGKTGGWDKT